MTDELQEKLKKMNENKNPLDQVIKTMLKSEAKSCVRAQVKLENLEKDEKTSNR
jgi:hypothetical protein